MRLHAPAGLAGISGAQVFKAFCAASDSVGNAVYARTDEIFDLPRVGTVDINSSPIQPAIGVIVQKFSSTECLVQTAGIISDIFSGLTFNTYLFIDLDGSLREGPPDNPTTGIRVSQTIGYALTNNLVLVQVQIPIIKDST